MKTAAGADQIKRKSEMLVCYSGSNANPGLFHDR
jgi:hypothetical protein